MGQTAVPEIRLATYSGPTPAGNASDTAAPKRHRSVGDRVLTAAIAVVVAAAVAIFAVGLLGLLRIDTIQSGSMAPKLPIGTAVAVSPEPVSALRVGQIIAFVPPHPFEQVTVVHQVHRIRHLDGVTVVNTKGVANPVADPWNVVVRGRVWHVVAAVPYVGYVASALRVGGAQIVIVALLVSAAGMALTELLSRLRRR